VLVEMVVLVVAAPMAETTVDYILGRERALAAKAIEAGLEMLRILMEEEGAVALEPLD
jgi:hypothetical protein